MKGRGWLPEAKVVKNKATKKMNIKNTKIYKELVKLELAGNVDYEISYRGGHYGLSRGDAVDLLGIDGWGDYLPAKLGAFSNYLGGGLRGAIVSGGYDKKLPKNIAKKVDAFYAACKARYQDIEDNAGLNDEVDADGETNWDAVGTNRSRANGAVSGY